MEYYYFSLFVFAIVAYFIITDDSIAKLVYYISKLIKFQYEKIKWWIIHNPKTPWAKYFIWRRSLKLAEELMKEFNQSTDLK
jgi:hypothetical protein